MVGPVTIIEALTKVGFINPNSKIPPKMMVGNKCLFIFIFFILDLYWNVYNAILSYNMIFVNLDWNVYNTII